MELETEKEKYMTQKVDFYLKESIITIKDGMEKLKNILMIIVSVVY